MEWGVFCGEDTERQGGRRCKLEGAKVGHGGGFDFYVVYRSNCLAGPVWAKYVFTLLKKSRVSVKTRHLSCHYRMRKC